tara:strand:- start:304 stop:936 length:633 start_codon:yes stop_codon:yes gene_type:complete
VRIPEHPIFLKSIEYIQSQIGFTGLDEIQQSILERIIHSSGDMNLQSYLKFSPGACDSGINALKTGAIIITDTFMAKAAVAPLAKRTINADVRCILEKAPESIDPDLTTRSAISMKKVWLEFNKKQELLEPPIVLIGSSPTALMTLLDLIETGSLLPSLIIGMPVGFIGVSESKTRLLNSNCPHIVLEGSRGGAALAAATINALLRAADY